MKLKNIIIIQENPWTITPVLLIFINKSYYPKINNSEALGKFWPSPDFKFNENGLLSKVFTPPKLNESCVSVSKSSANRALPKHLSSLNLTPFNAIGLTKNVSYLFSGSPFPL